MLSPGAAIRTGPPRSEYAARRSLPSVAATASAPGQDAGKKGVAARSAPVLPAAATTSVPPARAEATASHRAGLSCVEPQDAVTTRAPLPMA